MLIWSIAVLGITVLAGLALIALLQWRPSAGRLWLPGLAHGLLGLTGFILLLAGLGGPPRGMQSGAGSFGLIAAVLAGAALTIGVMALLARLLRRRVPVLVLGIHATIGVAGLIILAAYLSAPA